MPVEYEWTVEGLDKHLDIVDSIFSPSYSEMLQDYKVMKEDMESKGVVSFDFAVIRRQFKETEGINEEIDKEYLYLDDGELPEFFAGGYKVPAHVRKQMKGK